jgi:hypothetical protein
LTWVFESKQMAKRVQVQSSKCNIY